MSQADIAAAYDQLAESWQDSRFNPDNGLAQHRRALAFLDGPGGHALNVGCGASTRFNAPLRELRLTMEGVDLSARMVAFAREADPTITVHHADICTWQPPHPYRFITAWDSVWHVPLESQRALYLKLMAMLAPGGVLIFTAGGLDAPAEHHEDRMGPSLYYASLGIPALLATITEAACVCRHLEFDQWPEKHLVLIAQRAT
ncbi:MAG: class I SAM-dependent methyltransferase [Gammaproteobacteria bacterium]|jgi:predicted TPR repeat methyltransferase|nr:class I SAM-dependent methyltransferase [Gammaproteobacteria bacterium]